MILKDLWHLANLFKVYVFYIHEAIKILSICEDNYFMPTVFQIVISYLKSFDNSQKFAIMGFILDFY